LAMASLWEWKRAQLKVLNKDWETHSLQRKMLVITTSVARFPLEFTLQKNSTEESWKIPTFKAMIPVIVKEDMLAEFLNIILEIRIWVNENVRIPPRIHWMVC